MLKAAGELQRASRNDDTAAAADEGDQEKRRAGSRLVINSSVRKSKNRAAVDVVQLLIDGGVVPLAVVGDGAAAARAQVSLLPVDRAIVDEVAT